MATSNPLLNSYPVPSGINLLPTISGANAGGSSIGSAALPFNDIRAVTFNGASLSSSFTGGTITSNLTPTTSGTLNIGTAALPFSGSYSNQYATTLLSQTIIGTTATINWNDGSAQYIDFTGGVSGTCTLTFSNPIGGSSYILSTKQNTSGTTSVIFPSSVKWQSYGSGTLTATNAALDLFTFYNYDGTNYFGTAGYNFQ